MLHVTAAGRETKETAEGPIVMEPGACGQSTVDGIVRATNLLLAGSNIVVAGAGGCGRGVASRRRGAGANAVGTEMTPAKGLGSLTGGLPGMALAQRARPEDSRLSANPTTGWTRQNTGCPSRCARIPGMLLPI